MRGKRPVRTGDVHPVRIGLVPSALVLQLLGLGKQQCLAAIGRVIDIPLAALHVQYLHGEVVALVRATDTRKETVSLAIAESDRRVLEVLHLA